MVAPMIANNLREARDTKGLTIEELAADCGIKARSIMRYESGERMPRHDVAVAIARVLAMQTDDIWPREET